MHPTIAAAQAFACERYERHAMRRAYSQNSYVIHPREVAAWVQSVRHTPAMVAAAWCHDLIEDRLCTEDELRQHVGHECTDLTLELSTPPSTACRHERALLECQRLRSLSAHAQTIKLADILSNTRDIVDCNARFASIYLPEKDAQLRVLTKGSPTLWLQACHRIEQQRQRLHRHGNRVFN